MRRAGVLCVVVLVAGCGSDAPGPQGGPLGPGKQLQTATCGHWTKASERQRANTVDRLEEVAAGPRQEGGTLPDTLGYATLAARCKPDYAMGFLLYELYNRAAAFRSLVGQAR